MNQVLKIRYQGKLATSGSKRAFVVQTKSGPQARLTPDNPRQRPFQNALADLARQCIEVQQWEPIWEGPVALTVTLSLRRPRSHLGTGKNAGVVKGSAPQHPVSKPDSLKVCRAIEDALIGVCYRDDSQVVAHAIVKEYSLQSEGCLIQIAEYSI